MEKFLVIPRMCFLLFVSSFHLTNEIIPNPKYKEKRKKYMWYNV